MIKLQYRPFSAADWITVCTLSDYTLPLPQSDHSGLIDPGELHVSINEADKGSDATIWDLIKNSTESKEWRLIENKNNVSKQYFGFIKNYDGHLLIIKLSGEQPS
tara:strand:- start:46172 stop:46486 length:315 start_codon:yes stop_codon:yes gene_type:complete